MKKFRNIFTFFITLIMGAQQIQSNDQSNFHWSQFTNFFQSSSKKRLALIATMATLGSVHVYKRYVAPHLFKVTNIVNESMTYEEKTTALGTALADAVASNPFLENTFYWGVSTACSQNESESGTSTLSQDYIQKSPKKDSWIPLGDACLSNQFRQDDNKKVQALGCNMYRFSIDWSRVQPKENMTNLTRINEYAQQCRDLIDRGITPMICFHHYCDPIWFIEKGGFEKEENIKYFVTFCELIVRELGTIGVQYWLVMNQPLAYVNKGYLDGSLPPFKKATVTPQAIFTGKAMETASAVRKNICKAHVKVSKAIKKINKTHKVGASHQITPMKAGRYWSIDPVVGYLADKFYNQTFLDFAKKEKKHFDFIALSFYSPCRFTLLDIGLCPKKFNIASMNAFWSSEVQGNKTDDPKRIIDAQGFFDAVKRVAKNVGKDKEIIIIESGADLKNETDRINYFNKTMSAIVKTLRAGYNLKGFCVWTLMDNYEWGKGYTAHFGLYSRRTHQNDGELKDGGKYYRDIISEFKKKKGKRYAK